MTRLQHRHLAAACLFLLACAAGRALADDATTPPKPPLGLPAVSWPAENPYSKAKADLGRLLYYDNRLSSDHSVSCASCHAPAQAFTDNLPVSLGIGKQKGGRNAPTVINRAYSTIQFWDGRAATLEEQAKGPLANPVEMTIDKESDSAHKSVVKRIREIKGYVPLFQAAFGPAVSSPEAITIDQVAQAIATYERTVYSGNSPFDRYEEGDDNAMSRSAIRGMEVYNGKARCADCHKGFNFTDESYANLGVGFEGPNPDMGRYVVTKQEKDRGAFKTPTLRDVEHTAPYMHDGSLETLEQVVEHYDRGGTKNNWLDPRVKSLKLTLQEKRDLVEFMKALSGEGWQDHKPPTDDELPK